MKRSLMLLAFALVFASSLSAQTVGPSPTPGPTVTGTTFTEWTPSPTPGPTLTPSATFVFVSSLVPVPGGIVIPTRVPTIIVTPLPDAPEIPQNEIYMWLATADANLRILPADITANQFVPNEDGRQLFGYAKWMLSSSVADEIVGPFAPIIQHGSAIVGLLILLAVIWVIFSIVRFIIRVIIWVIAQILKAIPGMG